MFTQVKVGVLNPAPPEVPAAGRRGAEENELKIRMLDQAPENFPCLAASLTTVTAVRLLFRLLLKIFEDKTRRSVFVSVTSAVL